MQMTSVDTAASNFNSGMQEIIANALQTAVGCVTVTALTPMTRRLQSEVTVPGSAGVRLGMTPTELEVTLLDASTQQAVCSAFGTSNACAVLGVSASQHTTTVATTTTTTSEMPWGLPWWAWFLICCLLLFCCAACLGGGGAAGGMMGGKKSKKKSQFATEDHVAYEVVDVPIEGAATSGATAPMASYPMAAPMATSTIPMGTAMPMNTMPAPAYYY
eukprot:CAMPEP_0178403888 /NCGR_PEP_ID=MMETSP0689_2-20121128/17600_1 /TAXON_ID=160604 /ORGANISM="Amphidinium massartii, Strain CS-259" /LENGTH=216 /DNA_ID=CAMNT_0020024855 /DNA_START=209 /DNA_END=859 /DNA_ORIENTATION=+